MVVDGKVPANPAKKSDPNGFIGPDPDFLSFNIKNRLRDCVPPFKFDFDGSVTGAKCYYREKQEEADDMPAFDPIPAGAEIALTRPRPNKQTGEVGIGSYKLNLPVTFDPSLREQHWGDWEGLTIPSIQENFAKKQLNLWICL